MGADEGREIRGGEALVDEELEQRVVVGAWAKPGREQALRRLGIRIRAADQNGDFWAQGAGSSCVGTRELDDVCSTDALVLVRAGPLVAQEVEIRLEASALGALNLGRVEQQGPVGSSAGWGDEGVFGTEGASIVEGKADSCASEIGAQAVGAEEGGGQVGGEGGVDGRAGGGLASEKRGEAGFGIVEGESLSGGQGKEEGKERGEEVHFG